jgi:hypothetical protein
MRLIISGDHADQLVIAEPFSVAGSEERFAVHRAIGLDVKEKGAWSATHVETGFRLASGDTIDDAIAACRLVWASKSPEQIAEARARAVAIRESRRSREVFQ